MNTQPPEMTHDQVSPLQPGAVVQVRSRRYLVEAVEPATNTSWEQTLVDLSCLDDDAQGERLSVLWEREVDATVLQASLWNTVASRGFDPPDKFAAYLNAIRWNLVTSTNPKLFQAPHRAGIQVMTYQLEPLRKALLLPRVNLFIADDVGLGKTIEAGLILRELIMRQKVKRIVIACPASVITQWQTEMEVRFGLTFVILDREYVIRCRRERGYGVNPWKTHARFIVSHSLLRDEDYGEPLRDWLQENKPGSMLVLDEAHHAAPATSSRYAVDSQFTRAMRDLTGLFEHRLFLSATPHNGHSNSFSALLEMLDPQRFFRGEKVTNPKLLDEVMVRRLKDELRELVPNLGLPKRVPKQHDISGLPEDAPELKLMRQLSQYSPILAKHSKNFSLEDSLSIGVDRMQRNFEPMRRQVETWRAQQLTTTAAKLTIYRAFIEGDLDTPKHLARKVHELYFTPQHQEFEFRTMWSLSNAFTSAFKELDPIPQFRATARLGSFLETMSSTC